MVKTCKSKTKCRAAKTCMKRKKKGDEGKNSTKINVVNPLTEDEGSDASGSGEEGEEGAAFREVLVVPVARLCDVL